MIHFHKWDKFYDLKYTELNYEIRRTYRYCHICCRWQRRIHLWYESFWEDSHTPEGVDELIHEEKAERIVYLIKMKNNSRRK